MVHPHALSLGSVTTLVNSSIRVTIYMEIDVYNQRIRDPKV
jgi:hypothetical protein